MPASERLTPDQLPTPWLMDTEKLLSELARIRSLALTVPVTNETYGPTNTVVDAIWDLESRMRFMLQTLRTSQREFAQRALTESTAAKENTGVRNKSSAALLGCKRSNTG